MTHDDFKQWRARLGLTQAAAAQALGLSKRAVENYERGARPGGGEPVVIPATVALACAAVAAGLAPWRAK